MYVCITYIIMYINIVVYRRLSVIRISMYAQIFFAVCVKVTKIMHFGKSKIYNINF